MATELQSLLIEIKARDAAFVAALQGVEARLASFTQKVQASTLKAEAAFNKMSLSVSKVQSAFAALGSITGLGGLTALTKAALDMAGDLVDTADRIGVSVEALQELQFAAGQSGVSIEEFNSSLQIFSRRLSEAASGTGEAKKVLDAFRLSAADLAKDPVRALTIIADKIAGMANQSQKLEAINKLFGRGGAAMVNFLQQGGPAIDEMRQKIQELGGVIDEDLARKSEAAGDEFATFTQVISTQFKSALLDLAPVLVSTAKLIAEMTKKGREFMTGFDLSKMLKQAKAFDIRAQIEGLESKLTKTEGGLFGVSSEDMAAAQKRIALLREELKTLTAVEIEWTEATDTSATAVKKLGTEVYDFSDASEKAAEKAAKAAAALAKQRAELEQQIAAQLEVNRIQQLIAQGTITEEEGLRRMAEAAVVAEKGTEDLAKKLAVLKFEYEQQEDILTKVKDLTKQMREEETKRLEKMDETAKNIQSQITANELQVKAIEEGIAAGRVYDDILRDIAIRQKEAELTAEGFGEKAHEMAVALENSNAAVKKSTETLEQYADKVSQAALSTADVKTFTQGILQGTQDLGELFKDLGQTMGVRLVEGVLFGKGQKEQAILGNFNQLLGVQAQGIFGAQGTNLGNTLVSSLSGALQNVGIDLGSLFGQSFGTSAGQAATGQFSNVIAGGSSTAASAGSAFGTVFGGFAAGAAGMAFGKGLASVLGIGGGGASRTGGTVGGIVGGIAGFALGGPLGAGIGSAAGSFFGTIIGSFFEHTPTRGTQIRKGVKDFLKEIEVSFASEIDSGEYFFEETKKLAEKMFGGSDGKDFLKASKVILEDKIGPELARQLQALGTVITADQADKLGKSVEQTGTTFGNLLLDNLGLNPKEIEAAVQEIVQKAGINFGSLATKLTDLFEDNQISVEFYTDTIQGAVDLFFGDLPDAINVSAVALKSFTEEGLFDLKTFESELAKVTGTFDAITQAFITAVTNDEPGVKIGKLLANQIAVGLEDLAVNQFLTDFFKNELFKDIDLSDGLAAEELALIIERAGTARETVEQLWDAFGDPGKEIDQTKEKVEDLFEKLRELTQQRFDLRLDVLGDLEAVGAISGIEEAQARITAQRAALAGLGAGTRTDFSDLELEQGLESIRAMRAAAVDLFRAQEQAAQKALQQQIKNINEEYDARRKALQKEAQAAADASEDHLEALAEEKDAVQELFETRLDALKEELQIAESFKQAAAQIRQTIDTIVQQTSPLVRPEQMAFFAGRAAELRAQLATAPRAEQADIIQELSGVLQNQLQVGKEFLDPTRFTLLFTDVMRELESLRDQTTTEGERTEALQQEIATTTAQMEVQLRNIDASIKQAQDEAEAAQRELQLAEEALSDQEQAAIKAAEAATTAELAILRQQAVQEIQNLGLIEDAILAEQIRRASADADFNAEQLSILGSINAGISNLETSLGAFLDAALTQQTTTASPDSISGFVQTATSGGSVNVSVAVPISTISGGDNPKAIEEYVIQLVADQIRRDGKIRRAIQEVW